MSGAPLEIERVWVLRGAPVVPAGAEIWRIEQGYMPEQPLDAADFAEGRLRRITRPDGGVRHVHTLKRGAGLVREELEREIDAEAFDRAWPATQGRRVRKRRHRVREGALVWEIDEFLDWPLWMAEVELPGAEADAPIPAWLAPVLGPEVTHDARWRNHALAVHGPPMPPRPDFRDFGGCCYHLGPTETPWPPPSAARSSPPVPSPSLKRRPTSAFRPSTARRA